MIEKILFLMAVIVTVTSTWRFLGLPASELLKYGSRWVVPKALHASIDQQAVLLKTGATNPAARAFLAFLKSRQAIAIIRRYGYETHR